MLLFEKNIKMMAHLIMPIYLVLYRDHLVTNLLALHIRLTVITRPKVKTKSRQRNHKNVDI